MNSQELFNKLNEHMAYDSEAIVKVMDVNSGLLFDITSVILQYDGDGVPGATVFLNVEES